MARTLLVSHIAMCADADLHCGKDLHCLLVSQITMSADGGLHCGKDIVCW